MARPPFPKITDFLQIYPGEKNAGQDPVNLRDVYYPISDATLTDQYTPVGGGSLVRGAWTNDGGDLTLPDSQKEPRVFCTKGKLSITVNGTAIIARVQVNSSWGKANIYIDGVKPSTISGLATYLDVLDCDADNYSGVNGTAYLDVVIADGLSAGNHTVDLYANNSGGDAWVALSAIKTRSYTQKPFIAKGWRSPVTTGLNNRTISFKNLSSESVKQATLTFPSKMVHTDGSAYLSPVSIGDISPGAQFDFTYGIDGSAEPDSTVYTLQMTALYADPAGTVQFTSNDTHDANSAGLTFTGSWGKDQDTPGAVWRAYSTATNQKVSFSTDATSFVITVQMDSGWGTVKVMVGATQYGTITSNDTGDGGGYLHDVTFTGLPAGTKTVDLITTTGGAKPFVFTKISFSKTAYYTQVTENVLLNYAYSYVPPFAPKNVRLQEGQVIWDPSNRNEVDISLPRDNSGLTEYRVYTRFPTYCVYYAGGKEDILSDYDALIIEPSAVSRKQVAAWQAQGIKVFGYVTFGEEDGDRSDPYDLASDAEGPQVDDGLGPGGYASYYNKGGNLFGEASECQFDNQRTLGQKTCAKANPKYFTGLGRCGEACSKDFRDGYKIQQEGGQCGGGFTINNKWQRDAMKACNNTTCSGYTPLHSNCPQFETGEVIWGQDFSIATPNYPDQNGIWASSFINPIAPRWKQKLETFYLPPVFGAGQDRVETKTLVSHTIGSDTKLVFRADHYPIDDAEELMLQTSDGTITYVKNVDYAYDSKTGVFVVELTAGADGGYTPPVAGQQLKLTYHQKGLQCDGVFMDTVDTVDVYPSEEFNQAMADMINALKASNPTKMFCSNRGFGVLDKIISSCSHVMFETFLSEYNWETGEYYELTDPETVSYNNGIKEQLRQLRRTNKFDVFALNYCSNGDEGAALRQKITDECYKEGYLSWTSTILLNDPLSVQTMNVNPGGAIRSTVWNLLRKSKVL